MATRNVRICLYGGTDLPEVAGNFVSELAHRILRSIEASVIVTGGFCYSDKNRTSISTDVAALRGAKRYAAEQKADLKDDYEAWIPDPSLDHRPDGNAVRMSEADGITLRVMGGRTPLGRRLAMVAGVDLVLTISGKQHAEVVVEQAIELGIPVIPIPHAGGDSEDLLTKYKSKIAASFASGALELCLDRVTRALKENDPGAAAEAVIALMRTAKVGKCLVLLPYDDEHDVLYKSIIEPAVVRHMIPLRLDRLPKSEAIYSSFADAIQSASALIADITVLNENVMYEIGFAHGRGLTPLLYTRDADRLVNLPVYLRTLNVRLANSAFPIERLIDDYLASAKKARLLEPFPHAAVA